MRHGTTPVHPEAHNQHSLPTNTKQQTQIIPTQLPLELYAVPDSQAPHMYPVRLLAQALFHAKYADTTPAASVSAEDET
jgi:hypothetical protein